MRIAISSWRARLLFDAYSLLPNGEGFHKVVREPYIELARQRGLTLPKKFENIIQGMKDELHRDSADSIVYKKWADRRPDIFYQLERGRWGVRPVVLEQAQKLHLDDQSILAGVPSAQPMLSKHLFENDEKFHNSQLYLLEMLDPYARAAGRLVIKIGHGKDVFDRRNQLQTGNPYKIVPRFAVHGKNIVELERKLHNQLGSLGKRMLGEWFNVDLNDLTRIGAEIVVHNFK